MIRNEAQEKAICTIEGPVLVVAGPGTGKTTLLTRRIEHILKTTDTPAETIMCLTFTENAADEMRLRLRKLIGSEADKVTIRTYHALGSSILREHRDFYDSSPLDAAVDELTQDQLIRTLIKKLPPGGPLLHADSYTRDIKSLMSEVKRANMTANDLRRTLMENLADIEAISTYAKEIPPFRAISKKVVPFFHQLLDAASKLSLGEFGQMFCDQLSNALDDVATTGKTTALTAWKNTWLEKGADNKFVASGTRQHRKLLAFADLMDLYQESLEKQGLYDYDDMIVKAIELMNTNQDLRYSIQEKYLYYLLDEFQDTNLSQFELVKCLTDNPVHEGRPNIMAVGDDDQAIFAFQGANHNNMRAFLETYVGTTVIPLRQNYRSGSNLIERSNALRQQIEQPITHPQLDAKMIESVKASNTSLHAHHFATDIEEMSWLASEIQKLRHKKTKLSDIAIIAPKHKYLERITAYLHSVGIPLAYEKRENILDDHVVRLLETICRILVVLPEHAAQADSALMELFSDPMWQLDSVELWRISLAARAEHELLSETLLSHESTSATMRWLIDLSMRTASLGLEQTIDEIIGQPVGSVSPLYRHYFADPHSAQFASLLNNLQLIRRKLRSYVQHEDSTPSVKDFLDFVEQYRSSGLGIMNTNPYLEADDAVTLLTTYKAKGREFAWVFLPFLVSEVWGSKSRDASSNLTLPVTLDYISYSGKSDDERRRILYVAMTRAEDGLYLLTHDKEADGHAQTPLEFLNDIDFKATKSELAEPAAVLQAEWHDTHLADFARGQGGELIRSSIDRFRLSASALNHFTNLQYGGPNSFLLHYILHFPSSDIPEALYGDAFHRSLDWAHAYSIEHGQPPTAAALEQDFEARMKRLPFSRDDRDYFTKRGLHSLVGVVAATQDLSTDAHFSEVGFRSENVMFGDIRLGGSIDRLHVDHDAKKITVYDFKTGKSFDRWDTREAKLHTYKKQLMFYKLLVEHSLKYRGFTVEKAALVFVEKSDDGEFVRLELIIDDQEYRTFQRLVEAVWQRIMHADMPDVKSFGADLKGIRAFEESLL